MLIRHKIVLAFIAFSLVVALVGGLSFYLDIIEAEKIAQHEAESIARTVAFDLGVHGHIKTPADLQKAVQHLKNLHDRDIVVVDRNQKIIADAVTPEVGTTFNHDSGDEVGLTLKDGESRTFIEVSESYPDGIRLLTVPLNSDREERLGALIMEYTPLYREILGFIKQDAKRFVFFYFITLGIALTMGYVLARNVTMSLNKIQDAARKIADGDLNTRMEQRSDDELGSVAESFNRMIEEIRESRDTLVQLNERLLDDIEKRRAVEESLRQSEQRLRTLIDAIPDSTFFKDAEGRHLLGNKAFEESFGFSPEELSGKTVEDLLPPDVAAQCRANDEKVLKGHKLVREEEQMHGPDGNLMIFDTIRVPLYDESGSPSGLVGIIRDVTEQKMAEKTLRENEEKLSHLFEFANDGIFIVDLEGNIIDVNRTAHERLGYTKKELCSMHLSVLDPPEYSVMVHERIEYLKKQGKAVFESAQKRKDGTIMPVEVNACMMELKSQKVLFSVARDITERKLADEQLLESLREKEILLQEIHHRVKNNMSIIMSLLRLQAGQINNQEVKTLFMESQNRIKSMALIHEKLYLEGDLLRINFRKYVENLVSDLFHSYQVGVGEVSYSVDVDHVPMEIDIMVPCGLIINELVTNSLKHAFAGIASPEVRISLTAVDNGRVLLMVGDNGQGLPPDIDVVNGTSLGLQIVNGLVRQLGGTLELDRNSGTSFNVSFELPRKAQE